MLNRKTGYLANVWNIPPLIFRFQFNPDVLTEKKSFKYDAANAFGKWGFDQTTSGAGFKHVTGLLNDAKEISSLLVASKPLEPKEGDPRTFDLEFKLDGSVPGPLDKGKHYDGSILPDLAVLRSFTLPWWDVIDLAKIVITRKVGCFNTPPTCTLNYGGLSVECVMTDLTIKVTAFKDDGDPLRADVTCTLKEQTYSTDPLVGTIKRIAGIIDSYERPHLEVDFEVNAPVVGGFVEGKIDGGFD
jgi:hypothetical protein